MALEQDTDDAWNLFNLINIGDLIKGSAYRYVSRCVMEINYAGKFRRRLIQGWYLILRKGLIVLSASRYVFYRLPLN